MIGYGDHSSERTRVTLSPCQALILNLRVTTWTSLVRGTYILAAKELMPGRCQRPHVGASTSHLRRFIRPVAPSLHDLHDINPN